MKPTGYILACYLLLLSAVPCCIFDNCPDEKDVAAHSTQTDTHKQGDGDCGGCSPFFNCESCPAATIAYEPLPIGISSIDVPAVYSNYIGSALPVIDYEFWQPPKLD